MKKLAAIMMTALVINLFSPLMPQVSAASLDEQLLSTITQNTNAAQIQELLKIKQDLEQVNREVLLTSLTKAALERIPAESLVNTTQSNGLNGLVQGVVEQQLNKNIPGILSGYQKELAVLSLLFGQGNTLNSSFFTSDNAEQAVLP